MAPNVLGNTILLAETCIASENNNNHINNKSVLNSRQNSVSRLNSTDNEKQIEKQKTATPQTQQTSLSEESFLGSLVWRNIIAFTYLHLGFLYGFYLAVFEAKISTVAFALLLGAYGAFGITAGTHRLWSHKAYKAKWQLRLFLMVAQTLAFQNSIYEWVRDHRVHHKFTDTNADPHNAKRGFFFSHIGWLMCKKHLDVKNKGKLVDMSDLEDDSIVMFQKRYYLWLMPLVSFVLPTWIACHFFGETLTNAWYVVAIFRYVWSLNATWLVNSAAHIWGMRPYDRSITPTDSTFVGLAAFGEGWHNYHHVFPWDYKTSELGKYGTNFTTAFIDFFAKIGWAYDLKTVSSDMIRKRVLRTGDGSHVYSQKEEEQQMLDFCSSLNHDEIENPVWGWDDKDMNDEDKQDATVFNKSD